MRDPNAVTLTNHALVEEMRQRRINRKPELYPFSYSWQHTSTGNSGTGFINMPSRAALVEWVARWNHTNFANGWNYSIP